MRVLSLLVGLVCLSTTAIAQDNCVAVKDFYDRGGVLKKAKVTDIMQIISPAILLDCGDKQCSATIVVEGVIDADGSLRDLKVTQNTYTEKRDARAAALLQWKEKMRYEPPVLDGKPVCVRQVWIHKFGPSDPP